MCHCVCVPVTPACGHTPWLECVHASVCEFMSTWLPMSIAPPMHSLMETWAFLSCIISHHNHPPFWSHTLVRMCGCISTCIQVHLTPEVCSTPLCIVTWKCGFPCVTECVCSNQSTPVPTPHCLECVHASVHVFMLTWLPALAKPPMDSPTPWLKYVPASVHVYMSTWLTMSVLPLLNS